MRLLTETVDGVTVGDLSAEVRAVVYLLGLMACSLLVYLVLTEVSLSVSKSHDPQPDKNLKSKANVSEVHH